MHTITLLKSLIKEYSIQREILTRARRSQSFVCLLKSPIIFRQIKKKYSKNNHHSLITLARTKHNCTYHRLTLFSHELRYLNSSEQLIILFRINGSRLLKQKKNLFIFIPLHKKTHFSLTVNKAPLKVFKRTNHD